MQDRTHGKIGDFGFLSSGLTYCWATCRNFPGTVGGVLWLLVGETIALCITKQPVDILSLLFGIVG